MCSSDLKTLPSYEHWTFHLMTDKKDTIIAQYDVAFSNQIIRGFIPLSEMFGYATDLRSKTQGRGTYSMEPSHYEEVPKSVLEQIVASRSKKAE